MTPSASRSAQKAAELYDQRYAERYRAHDDTLTDSGPCLGFVSWLQRVCDQFNGPIDALELGCGTGRYFSALRNVRSLVGLDVANSGSRESRQRSIWAQPKAATRFG